jgi:hypothetical protein
MPPPPRTDLTADVECQHGKVVLTVTSEQAQAVAATLAGRTITVEDAPIDWWLDDVVHSLARTAAELDTSQVSRHDFLRGGWMSPSPRASGLPAWSPVADAVAVAALAHTRVPAQADLDQVSDVVVHFEDLVISGVERTAAAARLARDTRAVSTALAASAASGASAQADAAVRLHAHVVAAEGAVTALAAASALAARLPTDADAGAALAACRLEATDTAAAMAAAEEIALTAAAVAGAVATAAAQAAVIASAAARAFETEVAGVSLASRTAATETAGQAGADTGENVLEAALVARIRTAALDGAESEHAVAADRELVAAAGEMPPVAPKFTLTSHRST